MVGTLASTLLALYWAVSVLLGVLPPGTKARSQESPDPTALAQAPPLWRRAHTLRFYEAENKLN